MRPITKVRWCLALNVLLLSVVIVSIFTFASDSPYFRFGPHETFVLISVKIDTINRYLVLLVMISFMNCIKVVVAELGEPVLVFNVYNPDKRVITDFSRKQLLAYANLMFLVSNVRRVFEVMITVTQFDIAIFSIVVEQFVSMMTVCFLVSEKRFDGQLQLPAEPIDTSTEMVTVAKRASDGDFPMD